MIAMREHVVQWVTASPLWATSSATPAVMKRPALLRFESDTFMEDLAGILAKDPATLMGLVAQPKRYGPTPIGEDESQWRALPDSTTLKLFQPVHGHFNLVTATLVCQLPGMPDRALEPARGDKVGFLLRRLDSSGTEMAWQTAQDGSKGWQPVSGSRLKFVADGEELLPMFPVPFNENKRRRRLLVGLIPTSSRETFQSAPTLPAGVTPEDARPEEFKMRVRAVLESFGPTPPFSSDPLVVPQQADGSMFLLLDFADFLKRNNLDVIDGSGFTAAAQDLRDTLASTDMIPGVKWLDALRFAWQNRHKINGEDVPLVNPYNLVNVSFPTAFLDQLESKVGLALDADPTPPAPGKPTLPKLDPEGGASYRVRCAYVRPTCKPPHADLVSEPTRPFQLAPFFDPDAPARPIRIPMPVDTSLAGLRKFGKSVAFMTSDKLRNQLSTIGKEILKGNLNTGASPPFGLGEICSFSLPIITLCAMILLIVFVIVLNIAFFWLPIFRICLPIPLISPKK
jgi:hypothetical protein